MDMHKNSLQKVELRTAPKEKYFMSIHLKAMTTGTNIDA
jgi:hypothetical protein